MAHLLSIQSVFIAGMCFSPLVKAMPPHSDLLDRVAKGQQTVPYYLEHVAELHCAGVDSPYHTRTIAELRGARLDTEIPTLVILTDFSDNTSHVAASSFDALIYGDQTGTLKDYYSEVSYGNLTIVTLHLPSETDWQRAPQTYAYYVNNQNGFGAYPHNAQRLVEDVVNAVDPIVDFSHYDSDGDGNVDALFIVHAGRGAERSGSDADIWSHAWSTHTAPYLDGVWVRRYSMEPEYWDSYGDMTCGVFAHEMGHSVFGLPDLYDLDNSSKGLGKWSLMAGGSWNGTMGSSPAHPDPWCKIAMGLITPTNIMSDTNGVSIPQVETSPTVFRLWTDGILGSQYFLVENRQRTGYDAALPPSGLLIYHIDENAPNNNNEWYPGRPAGNRYRVALEQADGLWQLEHNTSSGGHGDPYPGSTDNHVFDNTSTPDSRTYAGSNTNVAVRNISASVATMTADFSVRSCTPPSQVTSLSASTNRCADVLLTWDDVANAGGFRVYRNSVRIGNDLGAHTTSYTDVNAVAGTSYNYTVQAFQGICVGQQSSVVTGMRQAAPAQVTGVTATTNRCSDVIVGWNDIAGETGYRVLRNGLQVGDDFASNSTSFTDVSAVPGTSYSYIVVAFNSTCTSANSAAATGLRIVTPIQVSGVMASSNRCSDVQVTWNDVSSETGYRVLRDGVQIGGDLAAGITIMLDPSAIVGTTYSYTVVAFNGSCSGAASAPANGVRAAVPNQVTGVSASTTRCSDVQVTWSFLSGVTGYRVYRNASQVGSDIAPGVTLFTDVSAVQGVNYTYSVAGVSSTCLGAQSSAVEGIRAVAPQQVTGLNATTNRCSDIVVSWSDVASATGFRLFRNGAQIGGDLPAHTVSFVDAGPDQGTSYSYSVQAFTGDCIGVLSASSTGMTISPPAQVNGVIATTDRCSDVMISWSDLTGESGYRVYRNGAIISVDVPANTTYYLDTFAPQGLTYNYTVAAFVGACAGQQSASSPGMKAITPPLVANVWASADRCSDVRVTWSDVSNASGFRVYRDGVQASADLPAHTVFYLDESAVASVSYTYTVIATNGNCTSPASASTSGMRIPAPAQVGNVFATCERCTDIIITWDDVASESGYRITRDGVPIGESLPANTTSFADLSAAPGSSYEYAVQAFTETCTAAASLPSTGLRLLPPGQITGVEATIGLCSVVVVTWTGDSNAAGYRVLRDGVQIGDDIDSHVTSFEDTSALEGASYSYAIVAFNGPCVAEASAPVVGMRQLTPSQVTGLVATQNRCNDILLTWNESASASGYRILRDGIHISGDLSAHTSSYSDITAIAGHSYNYSIICFNGSCLAPVSADAFGQRQAALDAVTGVVATDGNCTDITISWHSLAGADSFLIQRDGNPLAIVPSSLLSYVDITAQLGLHEYRVVAINVCGAGNPSGADFGTQSSLPAFVSDLSASIDHCSDVGLNWTSVVDAQGYVILRDSDSITTVQSGASSYIDLEAIPDQEHVYQAVSFNECGSASPSSPSIGVRRSVPSAVTGVVASDDRCDSVVVVWSDVEGATSYIIFQDGVEVSSVPPFTERTALLSPIGTHAFAIVAENACGSGALSVTDLGTRWEAPGMPLNVSASDAACGQVTLAWDMASGHVEGYVVNRDGVPLDTVEHITYTDSVTGTHWYEVYAINQFCGDGPPSQALNGVGNSPLPRVISLTASSSFCTHIDLQWSPVDDAEQYAIHRDSDSVGTVSGDIMSFIDYPPMPGAFSYMVTPINECGYGETSGPTIGERKSVPDEVRDVVATQSNCDGVVVMWSDLPDETSYIVYRDGDSLSFVGGSQLQFTDSTAIEEIVYAYSVRAENDCGVGQMSESANGVRMPNPPEVQDVAVSSDRCDSVIVTWTASRGNAVCNILRDGVVIGETPIEASMYADVPPAGDFNYSIQVDNLCGSGQMSPAARGSRLQPPAAPHDVVATDTLCGVVLVEWAPASGAVSDYAVFRDGTVVGVVQAGVYEFVDEVNVGTYEYSIQARGACGDGTPSELVTGISHGVPDPPPSLNVSTESCDRIELEWIATRGDILQYFVYRDGVLFDSTDIIEYADTTLHDAVQHTYAITARDMYCGESEPSAPITAGLQPLTIIAHDVSDTLVALDTVRVGLGHCTGASVDSLFISIAGSTFEFVAAYAPVQEDITFVVPHLDSVYTADCRLTIVSSRGQRSDSTVSRPFVISSPTLTDVLAGAHGIPLDFVLEQNYPNPFNPSTTIQYGVPSFSEVVIEVYDILSRRVAVLVKEYQSPGLHAVIWDASDFASGVYVVRMLAGSRVNTRKMVLLK